MSNIDICENNSNCWSVYVHTNITNGKKYVGITSRSVERRWQNGNGYNKGTVFRNAIDKYGWDGFRHDVLYSGLSEDDAKNMEIKLIKEFNTMDGHFGYNRTAGGEGTVGLVHTEETRNKMRMSHIGTHHSESTKKKISNSSIGNTKWLGKKHSEETKRKMSEAREQYYKENPVTEEESAERSVRAKSAYENDSTLKKRLSIARIKYFEENPDARKKLSGSRKELYNNNPELKKVISEIQSKPVDMYTIDGEYIQSFCSMTTAMKYTKIDRSSISRVCNGKQKQAGGFIWKYK